MRQIFCSVLVKINLLAMKFIHDMDSLFYLHMRRVSMSIKNSMLSFGIPGDEKHFKTTVEGGISDSHPCKQR